MLKVQTTATCLMARACEPSYSVGRDQEHCSLRPAQAKKKKKKSSVIPNTEKGWQSGSSGRAAQVAEQQPSKHEALSSSRSTTKNKSSENKHSSELRKIH
jgi:hypothetical protein